MASGVEELLDMLFDMVDEAKNVPLSSDKCMIERDRALDLIDDIRAQFPVELSEAKKVMATRADMLSSVTGSLDSLMRSIRTTVESVNLILDEENRAEVRQLLQRLNRTAGNLDNISSMLQSKSPDIETLLSNLSSISATLDSAATAISGTAANAEAITASLNEADLKGMTDSIRSLAGRLQSPDGSIGKLMRSDSLYNTLTALSSDLDSLVNNIRKDPKKYIKISIF